MIRQIVVSVWHNSYPLKSVRLSHFDLLVMVSWIARSKEKTNERRPGNG